MVMNDRVCSSESQYPQGLCERRLRLATRFVIRFSSSLLCLTRDAAHKKRKMRATHARILAAITTPRSASVHEFHLVSCDRADDGWAGTWKILVCVGHSDPQYCKIVVNGSMVSSRSGTFLTVVEVIILQESYRHLCSWCRISWVWRLMVITYLAYKNGK